jgi:hypothetical protein
MLFSIYNNQLKKKYKTLTFGLPLFFEGIYLNWACCTKIQLAQKRLNILLALPPYLFAIRRERG